MRASVCLGDQIDLIFSHLETDDGVSVRAEDRGTLRKTGCRTRNAGLEAQVRAGVDRLHDDGAVFAADQ